MPKYSQISRERRDSEKGTIPLLEFLEEHPVRKALSADSDTLQYTITPELVQHQMSADLASLLGIDK